MLSGNEINAHDYEIAVEGVCKLGRGGFCVSHLRAVSEMGYTWPAPICIPLDWCGFMFRIPDSLEGPDVFLDLMSVWG